MKPCAMSRCYHRASKKRELLFVHNRKNANCTVTWLKSIIARNRRHLCNREMISVGPAVWKKRELLFVHNQETTEDTNSDIIRGAARRKKARVKSIIARNRRHLATVR